MKRIKLKKLFMVKSWQVLPPYRSYGANLLIFSLFTISLWQIRFLLLVTSTFLILSGGLYTKLYIISLGLTGGRNWETFSDDVWFFWRRLGIFLLISGICRWTTCAAIQMQQRFSAVSPIDYPPWNSWRVFLILSIPFFCSQQRSRPRKLLFPKILF